MFSHWPTIISVLATFLPITSAADESTTYKLHHRIFHPSSPDALWAPRGELQLTHGSPAKILDSYEFRADLSAFAQAIRGALEENEDVFEVLYQVALERPGDSSPRDYDISSVRACHLDKAKADSFTFHVSPYDGVPHAVDYYISPIPLDGRCPAAFAGAGAKIAAKFNIREMTNTTIQTRSPFAPIAPMLKEPPQLSPQGDVVQPVPEKSFIQKYWIYIVGVLLAILIAPGVDDAPAGGQGGSGSGAAAGGGSRS